MKKQILLTREDLRNPQQTGNYDVYGDFKNLTAQDVNKTDDIFFYDAEQVIPLKIKNLSKQDECR